MKILAIDTSTSVMGVSLLDDKKVYAEIITNLKKNHSIRLMPTVDLIFSEVNWQPEDIDLIAVAKGPGSYTGVRIGVTTAKTLSWSLNIPLVGVSTLEAMAYSHHHFSGVISPVIDARREQVYTGLYKKTEVGFTNLKKDRIILLTDWLDNIMEYNEQVLFVGDDVQIHFDKIQQKKNIEALYSSPAFNTARPGIIGFLAGEKYLKGQTEDKFDFAPAYLQLTEAEVKWLAKG